MRARPLLACVFLVSCSVLLDWEEVDYCPESGCTTCGSDADCIVGSSCCADTFWCMHADDADFSVCSLGCTEPDPSDCLCQEGRCRFD